MRIILMTLIILLGMNTITYSQVDQKCKEKHPILDDLILIMDLEVVEIGGICLIVTEGPREKEITLIHVNAAVNPSEHFASINILPNNIGEVIPTLTFVFDTRKSRNSTEHEINIWYQELGSKKVLANSGEYFIGENKRFIRIPAWVNNQVIELIANACISEGDVNINFYFDQPEMFTLSNNSKLTIGEMILAYHALFQ